MKLRRYFRLMCSILLVTLNITFAQDPFPVVNLDTEIITAENAFLIEEIASLGVAGGGYPFWSSDSSTLYYATNAGTIAYPLDDLENPTLLRVNGHNVPMPARVPVTSITPAADEPVAVSPDGRYAVFYEELSAEDRTALLHIIETSTEQEIAVLRADVIGFRSYSGIPFIPLFTENGLLFLRDNVLYRWRPETMRQEWLLSEMVNECCIEIAISSTGRYAATYYILPFLGGSEWLKIWNLGAAPAELLFEREFPGTDRWHSVAFSPDGQHIATGGNSGNVRIWEVPTGGMSFTENIGPGELGENAVSDVSYSPDGTLIGGIDARRAFLLDAHTGEAIASIWGIGGTGFTFFNSVAFSPDGALIAFGAADGSIRLWGVEELLDMEETDAEDALQVLLGHEQMRPIVGLTFSPDGTRIASASWDTTVRVWDVESGSSIAVLDAHTDQAWGVAFHPDGRRLATSAEDGTVRLWDLETGTYIVFATVYPGSQGNRRALITDLQFMPDGSVLVGSHYSGDIYVWNTEQAVLLTRLYSGFNFLWHIDFNDDGTLLAAANYDSTVTLWGVPR